MCDCGTEFIIICVGEALVALVSSSQLGRKGMQVSKGTLDIGCSF